MPARKRENTNTYTKYLYCNSLRELWAGRKARMTPGQHGPLIPWATHAIQSPLQRVATGKPRANRKKGGASSDRSLQLDSLKPELLVIAGQHTAVNTFSSLVLTARQLKGVGSTRSPRLSFCLNKNLGGA